MSTQEIRFDDGAAYERFMGRWSQLAGRTFLEWLAPAGGSRWLDVGCGNGAFTEMLIDRCAPAMVRGVDPSEQQLAYATMRSRSTVAQFQRGDAMALPFAANTFDVAVMPLVIFFVPLPQVGVAEMARVVGPGGMVAAYAWDMLEGGFPYDALWVAMREMGVEVPLPPSADASRMTALQALWENASLTEIQTRAITVQRQFADFADYWSAVLNGPSVKRGLATMPPAELEDLQSRLQERLLPDSDGRITVTARANAIVGRIPATPRNDC